MAQHATLLRSASLIVLLAALSPPAAALAQAAAPMPASPGQTEANLDEVVVTAQKRAENVQDVPISISAFN
jgi:iron complex outermembrane receptor protein